MPCQAGPTERENLNAARTELDRLTAENDRLREIILAAAEGKRIPAKDLKFIAYNQVKHRKEDLARLEKQFKASIADQKAMGREGATDLHTKLGLVVTADPRKPLQPQLGFDPDSV